MVLKFTTIVFIVSNALLYSSLLPLWEAFDEPFHFGYVQYLANGYGLPDARTTYLSQEVAESIRLAPGSAIVQRNLPIILTYAQHFNGSSTERIQTREALKSIPAAYRWTMSQLINYEAQHAPLAYALLAIPERALACIVLPWRVLVLRIISGLLGALLLYMGITRLCTDLGLQHPYDGAACFCVFACQMTWATMAHIANDWLAVPLTIWLLSALIRYWRVPEVKSAVILGAVCAGALLAKAYALSFVPLLVLVCVVVRRWLYAALLGGIVTSVAGPWYLRNILKYGVLSGIQEAKAGVGVGDALRAMPQLNWLEVIISNARWMLWTGNNSFLSFSQTTLNILLAALAVGLSLWVLKPGKNSAEWLVPGHCGLFILGLTYMTLVSFVFTHGAASGPASWYSQVLLTPLILLAITGCSRSGTLGRFCASSLVVLFGHINIATYLWKLVPLYAGYSGRTSLSGVVAMYWFHFPSVKENLESIALGPWQAIAILIPVVTGTALAQTAGIVSLLVRSDLYSPLRVAAPRPRRQPG